MTVDQYFAQDVYYTIDTVVESLTLDPNRKFIYVEVAFFARWWEQSDDVKRAKATTLVKNKQLEFINGGWCMHDEASPLWTAMVDQTTRGHQFILKHFGAEASPRGTWQVDPFGHSNTQAWLLGAEAGFESLFWGRMDWQVPPPVCLGMTSARVPGRVWHTPSSRERWLAVFSQRGIAAFAPAVLLPPSPTHQHNSSYGVLLDCHGMVEGGRWKVEVGGRVWGMVGGVTNVAEVEMRYGNGREKGGGK